MKRKEWLERVISWFYPRRCPVCEEIVLFPDKICPSCRKKLHYIKEPICKCCGKELLEKEAELCYDCSRRKKSFRRGICLYSYASVKEPLLAIKYQNKKEYADFFAEEFVLRKGRELRDLKAEGILPVPMYAGKKRRRGFNQAELLAKKIGKELQIPVYTKVLTRTKATVAQKELGQSQRMKNLEQAFFVENSRGLRRVILFDDIYTTGATAEACSRVLRRAGIEEIYIAAVAIGAGQ